MKGMIISLHLSKRLFCSFFLLSSFPLLSPFQVFSAETPSCDSPVARLVSVEGEVQMQKVEEKNWHPVSVERLFCAGDRVQVGENSRAVVQVSDHSLVNLDAESILSFTQVEKVDGFWVSLLKGIGHFISRVPRQLNVETPFVNALVEGTEFLIHVAENETLVTVFEGTVFAKNQSGDLRLKSGESGKAKLAQAPLKVQVVRPRDAVHWALYYPSILQFDEKRLEGHSQGAWQSRMAKSIKHFKSGDLKKAFDALSEITDAVDDSSFLLYRASLHLTVGQVAKAQSTLDNVLRQTPGDNNALALKAVIAVVQNDRETALAFANKSVEGFPKSAGPYLARSYVFQSGFKLAEARKDVETAVTQYPDNPLAWARLAELRLMFRDLDGALKAAKRAVAIDPGIAKTETVLGFTHLVRIEIASAKAAFKKAIAKDQGSPMSRLGLGLAMIREGELEAGRREIEIAAMLDPGHSLIRSYLGKAYYEEKRDHLAVEQYQMARELDPRDPTPDLYSAILNQTNNRPVQALQNIERSITLNENRAVYRSRLLLDEDLAARSVSLGRIYQVLGFQKRALVEGWSSLSLDPSNHSAHRLLADSYATLPRHQIARASELLQSQLLQPLNMTPIQPQLAETNLAILERGGPSRLSFNEFTSHFARNQIDFQLNGLAGSNDTLGNDFVVSTVQNRTSFSLGQFHYETDGFRKNNDLKHDIYNLFGQIAATSKLNIQAEFRRRKTHNGDLNLNFDPADFSLTDRREILQDTARVGGHFVPSNKSIFIFSTIYSGSEDEARDRPGEVAPASDDLIDKKAYQGEAQYLFWHDRFNFIAGVGRYEVDEESQEILDWSLVSFSPFSPLFPFNGMVCPPPVSPCDIKRDIRSKSDTAYIYSNINFPKPLTWTLGLSYDSFERAALDLKEFSPKGGLQWDINEAARLRLSYTETIKGAVVVEQSIQPTQVTGFNQFFDELIGTQAKRYGVGLDVKLFKGLYGGVESARRDLLIPDFSMVPTTSVDRREDLHRAYLYWTPDPHWGASVEYQMEKLKDKTFLGPEKIATTTVPFEIRYFTPKDIFVQFGATYLHQKIGFGPSKTFDREKEDFMVLDTVVGYWLPKRWGIVSLGVRNLFNKTFLFQDTGFLGSEAVSPRFTPGRVILLRLTVIS